MDFWQGPNIRLRAVEPGDAQTFFTWNRDTEMSRHLDFLWPPGSLENQRRWAEKTATQEPANDVYFMVIEAPDGQVAGCIESHRCDRRTGTFAYGIAVRAEYQRRGYAREAVLLVLRYFFDELRYQKVTVNVNSNNPASIRLHESLGFLLEGRMRRMVFSGGQYFDKLIYGMTVEEYRAGSGPAYLAQAEKG